MSLLVLNFIIIPNLVPNPDFLFYHHLQRALLSAPFHGLKRQQTQKPDPDPHIYKWISLLDSFVLGEQMEQK